MTFLTNWRGPVPQEPRAWVCGFCGCGVGNNFAFVHADSATQRIFLCPACDRPTYFEGDVQVPAVAFGAEIANLPKDIEEVYREARNCMAVNAFTSAVLTCRKLLMHIAVTQGAAPGGKFIEYVDYLAGQGYVPPSGRPWLDRIRKRGNEATHEIALMSRADAEELLTFTEMLLRLVFDFPARVAGQ